VTPRWTDLDVARAVSRTLRGGLLLAALVAAIGGALYLVHHGTDVVAYRDFKGEPEALRSIRGIFRGVAGGGAQSIIQLGLVLLIATPIARVAFSLVGFYLEGDRRYVAITTLVLAILLFSLFGRV
jgi:uncharacterized membrane protein